MNNKGNQKHLTFEQRVDIEKGLTENKSFAEIGRTIGKDPSTISKEVRLHAHTKEHPDAGYTNPPSAVMFLYLNFKCSCASFKNGISVVVSVGWGPMVSHVMYSESTPC